MTSILPPSASNSDLDNLSSKAPLDGSEAVPRPAPSDAEYPDDYARNATRTAIPVLVVIAVSAIVILGTVVAVVLSSR